MASLHTSFRALRQGEALDSIATLGISASVIDRVLRLLGSFSVRVLIGLVLLSPFGCSKEPTSTLQGLASWYGHPHHGRITASGRRFDMYELTAAHRTLPLGTRLRVTNLNNGRSVKVVITDRGPFVKHRVIDLSYAAAQAIGMVVSGIAPVRLEVLP